MSLRFLHTADNPIGLSFNQYPEARERLLEERFASPRAWPSPNSTSRACCPGGAAPPLVGEDEAFTTQAAADYLGMSRPFPVGIFEKGEIPFHDVGSHRRVLFRELMNYENKRDAVRREGMSSLFQKVQAAGLDDASYTGK